MDNRRSWDSNCSNCSKGQYFSFDAIIAAVIFVMALVALLSYWHSVKSYLDGQNDQLSREAIRISNLLFTPPAPSSDCGSMTRLGLSYSWEDRRLSSETIACAERTAEREPRWLTGELATAYHVSIKVTRLVGGRGEGLDPTVPSVLAVIGGEVPEGVRDVVKMRRLATVYDERTHETYPATVDLSLYQ